MASCKTCNYDIDGELALYRTGDLLCDNCSYEKNVKALHEKVCPQCNESNKKGFISDFSVSEKEICVDCYDKEII